ncbi:hypothetical protein MVES_003404 [Malassezia vespertilionis]|uniref:DUF1748-domain-containing protein n=1 Tax=Malassezia vespertilionis TaxID=2020962 RepID=A0A2N1J7U5_9BASI|nr:hypothetical protein MVES_003404 [Malassezia vespertilionis]
MLGRLFHYTTDVMLVSTVLAGIKHTSGLAVNVDAIPEQNVRGVLRSLLGAGEYLFESSLSFAQNSKYFHVVNPARQLSFFARNEPPHMQQFPSSSPPHRW